MKKLIFTHHGREIPEARPTVERAIAACQIPVEIAFDGMKIELGELKIDRTPVGEAN